MISTGGAWIWAWVLLLLQWGLLPHLLSQRTKSPNGTLAWLWAILLFPGIGGVLYLLIGTEKVKRRRLAAVAALDQEVFLAEVEPPPDLLRRLPELAKINGRPATGDRRRRRTRQSEEPDYTRDPHDLSDRANPADPAERDDRDGDDD